MVPAVQPRELLVAAGGGRERLAAAEARMARWDANRPALVVAATLEAARGAVYRVLPADRVAVGWHATTLERIGG